jgi:IS4 transposase
MGIAVNFVSGKQRRQENRSQSDEINKSYQKGKEGSRNKNIFGFFNRGLTEKNLECIEDVDDFDIITAIHFSLNSDQQKDLESNFRLMKIYNRRWPNAIQFKLLLGDVMNKMGNVKKETN